MGENKERPILFSGPMVRAILDEKKTQTRRIVKPQPPESADMVKVGASDHPSEHHRHKISWFTPCDDTRDYWPCSYEECIPCPYGKPGDRLWVRESWQPIWAECNVPPKDGLRGPKGWAIKYPATDQVEEYYDEYRERVTSACKPSIHMPRWASRINLEITNVRVERLNEITPADILKEGAPEGIKCGDTFSWFRTLWNSINGPDSWKENPWVWVVEFKRVQ